MLPIVIEQTFYIFVAVLLMLAGSRWIDYLYTQPEAPLSFPDEVETRRRFRKPLLVISIYICISYFIDFALPESIYFIIISFFLLLITFTDFEQYTIFNKMLLPFAVIGFIRVVHLNLPITDHLMAALGAGVVFFILAIITKGAIGGGDIKLVAVLGIWFGSDKTLSIITTGFILGGIAAFIMLITKKKKRDSVLAYGPYFALTALALLFGL